MKINFKKLIALKKIKWQSNGTFQINTKTNDMHARFSKIKYISR